MDKAKFPANYLSFNYLFLVSVLTLGITGCQSIEELGRSVNEAQGTGEKLTVGKVQREIKVGMSSAQVIQVLGSPNVVSTDEQRREVWVYDKISTTRAVATSRGGASILILGVVGAAGASSTSQRTLTIIIKFNKKGTVRDFAYHTSRF